MNNNIKLIKDLAGNKYYVLKNKRLNVQNKDIEVFNDNVKELYGDFYYDEQLLHRIGRPAIEYANGDKEWYEDGKPHRIGGASN